VTEEFCVYITCYNCIVVLYIAIYQSHFWSLLLSADISPRTFFSIFVSSSLLISRFLKPMKKKIDYVKKRFVEAGIEVALNGRKGSRIYAKKKNEIKPWKPKLQQTQKPSCFSYTTTTAHYILQIVQKHFYRLFSHMRHYHQSKRLWRSCRRNSPSSPL
jgi:hypothetical protein